jgi:hypothetical protein
MNIICPERLYFDEFKREVVRQGDPRCSFLFRAVGQPITEEEVKQYHLAPLLKIPHEDKSALPEENKAPDLESLIVQETAAEKKDSVTDTFHALDEPAPATRTVQEELLAKSDAELAEIAKEYEVTETFEKKVDLVKAIMTAAGYKVKEK